MVSLDGIGERLHASLIGAPRLVTDSALSQLLQDASIAAPAHRFMPHFIRMEWEQVVDAWQISTWAEYRDVSRLGRRTRLTESQRQVLWSMYESVLSRLAEQRLITRAMMFCALADTLNTMPKAIFDFAVIDEAQDLSIAHLKFLSALGGLRPGALFFARDLGQRIFQQPFSWKSLGVDIRGRSRALRVNYRTSHQIRMQADRLLGPVLTDVDGDTEDRSDTVSVFNGPLPVLRICKNEVDETRVISEWLTDRADEGILPHEMGVFVRSAAQRERAEAAVRSAKQAFQVLDDRVETTRDHVSISTMHLAKGLEFRAVAVMACDDEVIPLQERIENIGDAAELQEVYETERHLLYVACTRARDHLLVSGIDPVSEFLDDMKF